MKKRLFLLLGTLCIVLCSCGQGVSQEEYDRVVAERDDYKEALLDTSDSLNKAIEELSIFEGLSFSESEGKNSKALIITSYLPLSNKEVGTKFEKLGQAISDKKGEEWFCYDFVFIELWNSEAGIITSIETKIDDMSLRSYQWYGNEEAETGRNEKEIGSSNTKTDEGTVVYQDENIIISYTGITGKESNYDVNFIIENLSDKTLIIQVRETSINGFMVDPMCSIEIAPEKKAMDKMTIWSDDAKNHPMSTVENIETKFHIFNDDGQDRYDTESIKIVGN